MVGSFVLQFRQPDRIPLDHIIHHGSQMDAQATSTAGAEHIINGMILVEINLCENGFTTTIELVLIQNRVPLIEVQQWLGHSTLETTADLYAHLEYETKWASAETLKKI